LRAPSGERGVAQRIVEYIRPPREELGRSRSASLKGVAGQEEGVLMDGAEGFVLSLVMLKVGVVAHCNGGISFDRGEGTMVLRFTNGA
jgi:hypothetical protein